MRFLVLLLAALPLIGATEDVRVFGVTPTQAIIGYTAENASAACQVEVSTDASYSPLVYDVDTAKFASSDQDSRTGSLANGRERFFVVGQRGTGTASDGKIYSRALQANTTHYFRINNDSACGTGTGTGTFHTRNIPFGSSRADGLPVASAGNYGFPTIDYDRDNRATTSYIDPLSGILVKPINLPNDRTYPSRTLSFTSTALGTNWTTPDNVLADDANNATYSAATNDWLMMKVNAGNWYTTRPVVKWIKWYVKGDSNGSGDDLILETCITTDGSTCRSDIQEITLSATPDTQHCYPYDGTPTTCGTNPTPISTWGDPTIIRTELHNNANFGVMARKKGTGGGTTTLQYAEVEMVGDVGTEYFFGGDAPSCQDVVKTDGSGNAGYYCIIPMVGTAGHIYWVGRDTGEARFLGRIYPNGANISAADANVVWSTWDESELGTFYILMTDTSGDQIIVKGVHDGGVDTSEADGYYDGYTWTNLTPDPNHLEALAETFTSGYSVPYVSADFTCATDGITVTGNYMFISCRRSGADSFAWHIVWKIGDRLPYGSCTGCQIQAAAATFNSAESRWCGDHSVGGFHHSEVFALYQPTQLDGGGAGDGPYNVTYSDCSGDGCSSPNLTSCSECQTTITVTSSHSTPGEPYSSNPPNELQDAQVGDVFRFMDGNREFAKIVTKNSPTSWLMQRSVGLDNAQAHNSGATMRAECYANRWEDFGEGGKIYWDFINDPNGDDGAYYTRSSSRNTDSHGQYNAGYYMAHYYWTGAGYGICQGTLLSGIVDCVPDVLITASGKCGQFEGKSAPCTAGTANYGSHNSSIHQVDAPASEKTWGMDAPEFIKGGEFGPSGITNVSGDLWEFTNSNLDRKYLATTAVCGVKPLQDVSNSTTASHQIQDTSADNYKYCYAEKNGECRTDSTAGEVFVNCPELTGTPVCTASVIGMNKEDEVCVGDRPNFGGATVQIMMDRARKPQENHYRRLVTPFGPFHAAMDVFSNVRQFPGAAADGSGIWAQTSWNRREGEMAYSFLVPPLPPEDTIDRTKFIPISVQVTGPANTDNAIAYFGYNEDFYCTGRLEACVLGTTDPFNWASDTITGISCAAGCTLEIPGISQQVLYYQIRYRDSGDNVIATGRTQVVAVR